MYSCIYIIVANAVPAHMESLKWKSNVKKQKSQAYLLISISSNIYLVCISHCTTQFAANPMQQSKELTNESSNATSAFKKPSALGQDD